jgi:hypothetical protein
MGGSRPDGWSRIGNFHISCKRVRTKVDWRPDGDIWIAVLALRRRASERDTTSSRWLINLSFIETSNESETSRVPRGVRTNASWIETSQHSGSSGRKCLVWLASGRYGTSSGRMEQWLDVRPTGWLDRPDGWQGNEIFDLSCSAKSSKRVLNSRIPVYNIFTHTSDFV